MATKISKINVAGTIYDINDLSKSIVHMSDDTGSRDLERFNVVKTTIEEYNTLLESGQTDPNTLYYTEEDENSEYLPLSAGEDNKISGPLGFTSTNYGDTLPEEELFEGRIFFLEDNESTIISGDYLPLTGGTVTGDIIIKNTYYPNFALIPNTTNQNGTYSKSVFEGGYEDKISLWINSNSANDTNSRRGLVVYGYAAQSDSKKSIALRQCDTAGNWLNDEYVLHTGNYSDYALPLSGGTVTGVTAFTNTTASSSTATGAVTIAGGLGVGGNIYGDKIYGAVWNDYAEYRICNEEFAAGRVVCENGDDTVSISTQRLQPGAMIVSDTFGFAIGETENAKCPVAVSGRVLAYTYEDRSKFAAGDAVCAGPNGTVSKMTRSEILTYPDKMIGTVSAIPSYKTWGSNNIEVDNRIWIKVR